MAIKLFIANLVLMVRVANNKNGILTMSNKIPSDNDVIFCNNREIPVAPPSIK